MATYSDARKRLFLTFDRIKPGAKINIEKESKGYPEIYIAICKEYIDAGNIDYEFSSDYKFFRRLLHKF